MREWVDTIVAFALICATLSLVFLLAFRWPITIIAAAIIIASAL